MNADGARLAGAREDERTRDRREKRATDRAIADERASGDALAKRRYDALLAYDPNEPPNYDSGFEGCVI